MLSFKPAMRKYLTLICISLSLVSYAQFQDNVFEKDQAKTDQSTASDTNTFDSQSRTGVPNGGEQGEGPGNPGEPVPINGLVPVLLLSGILIAVFYQKRVQNS